MRQGGLVLIAILLVACEPSAEHVAGGIATDDDRFATRILVLEELRAWELATPDQYAGGLILNEDAVIVWDSLATLEQEEL